jgi:site-specific DNA recombinase
MLSNPYYVGIVKWDGRTYAGRHEPLVDQQLFDRVQALLVGARISGERPQIHEHYLRGSVVCSKCRGRLLFGRHKSRNGTHYEYFSCSNRAARRRHVQCGSGHYSVREVEREVEELYGTVKLRPEVQDEVRRELADELQERSALIEREAERHERMLKQIEAKQEKLIQLYYRDRVTDDVFAAEQEKLKAEQRAAERLRASAAAQLEDVRVRLNSP